MISYIRNYTGHPTLDENLIKQWLQMAYRRVLSEAEWRWLYQTRESDVKRTGDLHLHTSLDGATQVLSVTVADSNPRELQFISWGDAYARWDSNDRGTATHYTALTDASDYPGGGGLRVGQLARVLLRVWPPADEDLACAVRVKTDGPIWEDNTDVPMPDPFVDCILMYALSETLQRDGYPDDARAQLARYHQTINNLRDEYISPIAGAIIVGAGVQGFTRVL